MPKDAIVQPKAYILELNKQNETIFNERNQIFQNLNNIFVGIDLSSGCFMVEGSDYLWDELCAFQGLDEKDLQNFVCVAIYVESLKRFNKL